MQLTYSDAMHHESFFREMEEGEEPVRRSQEPSKQMPGARQVQASNVFWMEPPK